MASMSVPGPVDLSGVDYPDALFFLLGFFLLVSWIGLNWSAYRTGRLDVGIVVMMGTLLLTMIGLSIYAEATVERDVREAIVDQTGLTVLDTADVRGGANVTLRGTDGELVRYYITVDLGDKAYFSPS